MTQIKRLRILNLGLVPSLDSQAIYHAVAASMNEASPDTVILCRPKDPYFCIGHHQNVRHVLNQSVRESLGYPVMRRRLGGGVTYLDSQQLFYQCIFHRSRSPAIPWMVYRERLAQPISLLNRIGVQAQLRYINEIEIAGRRIAGIGGGLVGEASVVVGNVLNDFEYRIMSDIIHAPCLEFRRLALSALLDRITTLKREGAGDCWHDLSELLIDEYRQRYGQAVYFGELSTKERNKAATLAEKMVSEDYLAEFRGDLPAQPLTRLKVSGSTSIELVKERRGTGVAKYFVLRLKDGSIEDCFELENEQKILHLPRLDESIRAFDPDTVQVGLQLDQS